MGLWLLFSIFLVGIFIFSWHLFQQKKKTYEHVIKSQETQLKVKDSELQERNSELQERNSELQERDSELQERDSELQEKDSELQERDSELQEKDSELQEKDSELQERDHGFKKEIEQLKKEKNTLEAKYLKKLTAADVKKNNLARYRRKMKSLRKKTIAEEAEEIVGKGPSWLPHSREGPKSHQMGKPKGSPGGGRKRPEKIHEEKELHAHKCYHCGTNLDGVKEYFVYNRVVTELFRYMEDEKDYLTLRLKNVKLIVKRKKCPNCKKWVYPEQGLLANNRIGLSLVSFVISRRIRTGLPYEVIIDELSTHFGSNFSISAPSFT